MASASSRSPYPLPWLSESTASLASLAPGSREDFGRLRAYLPGRQAASISKKERVKKPNILWGACSSARTKVFESPLSFCWRAVFCKNSLRAGSPQSQLSLRAALWTEGTSFIPPHRQRYRFSASRRFLGRKLVRICGFCVWCSRFL